MRYAVGHYGMLSHICAPSSLLRRLPSARSLDSRCKQRDEGATNADHGKHLLSRRKGMSWHRLAFASFRFPFHARLFAIRLRCRHIGSARKGDDCAGEAQ
jgi:hypothetical protein